MHSICNPYIYFVNTRILWSRVGIFKFDYLKSIKLSKGSSLFSHFTNTEGTTFLPGLLPATPGVSHGSDSGLGQSLGTWGHFATIKMDSG